MADIFRKIIDLNDVKAREQERSLKRVKKQSFKTSRDSNILLSKV